MGLNNFKIKSKFFYCFEIWRLASNCEIFGVFKFYFLTHGLSSMSNLFKYLKVKYPVICDRNEKESEILNLMPTEKVRHTLIWENNLRRIPPPTLLARSDVYLIIAPWPTDAKSAASVCHGRKIRFKLYIYTSCVLRSGLSPPAATQHLLRT